jgi:predicted small lipoprotein YifL
MSIRSRLVPVMAAAAILVSLAACGGGSSASAGPTLPPDKAAACAATSAFATAVQQFEGVDIQAIGVANLAPQINRLRGTFTAVGTSLDFVDVPSEQALRDAWATFDAALSAVDLENPTQESIDAAKAAAPAVRTEFANVQSELGCTT